MGWIDDCSQDGVCGIGHHLPFAQDQFQIEKKNITSFPCYELAHLIQLNKERKEK